MPRLSHSWNHNLTTPLHWSHEEKFKFTNICYCHCELWIVYVFSVLEFRFWFWFWTMFDETFDNFDLTYYWHDKTAKRYFFRLFAKPFIHSMRHLLVLHLQCKRRCVRDLGTKVEKIWDKMNLTGCNWSGLNAPGAETPVFHPLLVGSLFPFPLSGAIRNGGPQYQYQMLGTFWKKISLTGSKCSSLNAPDYWNPCVLFTFGGFPFPLSSLPLNASSAAAVRDAIRRSGKRGYNGKGEFSQLPIWMTQRGLSAWGIQTGPFAAL